MTDQRVADALVKRAKDGSVSTTSPTALIKAAATEAAKWGVDDTDAVVVYALRSLVDSHVLPLAVAAAIEAVVESGQVKIFVDDVVEPAEVACLARCFGRCKRKVPGAKA